MFGYCVTCSFPSGTCSTFKSIHRWIRVSTCEPVSITSILPTCVFAAYLCVCSTLLIDLLSVTVHITVRSLSLSWCRSSYIIIIREYPISPLNHLHASVPDPSSPLLFPELSLIYSRVRGRCLDDLHVSLAYCENSHGVTTAS